ncbi:hypothetical protein JHW43_005175 [Diplocarpon mali]|nr:hypothetical protein JHW43_005175 [Diplocarpon mali]
MEVAGLAIGILAVIKPTAEAIAAIWSASQNFGGDAERFRLRFSVQNTRLGAFERVLFAEGKFPLVQGRLFDQLPPALGEDLVGLLRQLYELLQKYYVVQKRYALDADGPGLVPGMAAMGLEEKVALAVGVGKENERRLAKGSSWTKKAMWVLSDKKSAEKLVVEFEAWTERVRSLLELAWWPLPFFSTASQMEKLEGDADAGQVGMLEGIGMRKLLAPGSDQASVVLAQGLKISRVQLRQTSRFQDLDIGHVEGQGAVIVEYKSYEQDRTGSINEIASRRILQLVALLHETKKSQFRAPRCTAFFDDVPGRRIGLAFELAAPSATTPAPTSLDTKLSSKKLKPSLGARFRLAHALAESLGHLHSVGWVHKSLRSENILFLPSPESTAASPTEPPETAILSHPTIFGFEYSRPDSDFSSGRPDYDIRRNIYRHPQRWGQPSETFSKLHDIYALGTMLLEIGLWESLSHLDGGALLTPPSHCTTSETAGATQTRLAKHVHRRLGFYAGERYQKVVLTCLQADFGVEVDDRLGSRLSAQFRKVVVDVLRELGASL